MERERSYAEPIVGVLLAGGQSRRMGGGDKCLRTLGGVTLLELVSARLQPQTDALVLNANGDLARFHRFGLPVIPDCFPDFAGPLAGILAGMIWTRHNHPHARYIAVTACDTPFFPLNLVATLYNAANTQQSLIAVAASEGRTHPTSGLWSTSLAESLHMAIASERRKLLNLIEEHNGITVSFPPARMEGIQIDPFFNINNPEDLATAESLLLKRK
jgi:molybdenum cofactor guanylyltransferase